MKVIIIICHLAGGCDRIVQPVDSCIMPMLQAEALMAKAGRVETGDRVTVSCEKHD
jgi:hypothetical protein